MQCSMAQSVTCLQLSWTVTEATTPGVELGVGVVAGCAALRHCRTLWRFGSVPFMKYYWSR